MANEFINECLDLQAEIQSDKGAVKENLSTAAKNACSLQLVTQLQSQNGELTVKAGTKDASCKWDDEGALFSGSYKNKEENTSGGDAGDEGFYYNVTMTKPIDVVDKKGGIATHTNQLKFVWLKGRAGKSGEEVAKERDVKVPGSSWYYKKRTFGKWPAWKGSTALFSPSFTGMSASVTGVSLGGTGISISLTGLDLAFAVRKVLKWGSFDDWTELELNLHGMKNTAKLSHILSFIAYRSVRTFATENYVSANEA